MVTANSLKATRVCILTETYYPVVGGGETQARMLARDLPDFGIVTFVLTRRSDIAYKAVEQVDGVTVFRLPPAGSWHFKKWGLLLTAPPRLLRSRRQYDLLFVSGFRILGLAAVISAKLLGKKCVLKADSLGEMSGEFFAAGLAKHGLRPSNWFFRFFLSIRNYILRRADAFIAISSIIADELTQNGVNQAAVHHIPNSVDVTQFHPVDSAEKSAIRERLDLEQEAIYVIYTGRLVSYKGLPLLVRVWRETAMAHKNARLLLVGTGGLDIHNCEEELRLFVVENALENSVMFTGAVENVADYLKAADIFVFPTENEAFGISLIEAMACGLPAVSTTVGGLRDIIKHERNGLEIEPRDSEQLLAALERLLSRSDLADDLGKAGSRFVQENYSVQRIVARYAGLFSELVGTGRAMS
jgi:glycosyltransferase involved in cell wall biosynthesis